MRKFLVLNFKWFAKWKPWRSQKVWRGVLKLHLYWVSNLRCNSVWDWPRFLGDKGILSILPPFIILTKPWQHLSNSVNPSFARAQSLQCTIQQSYTTYTIHTIHNIYTIHTQFTSALYHITHFALWLLNIVHCSCLKSAKLLWQSIYISLFTP